MDAEQVTEVEQERNNRKETYWLRDWWPIIHTGEDKNEENEWKNIIMTYSEKGTTQSRVYARRNWSHSIDG